jgi:hypothetical protein
MGLPETNDEFFVCPHCGATVQIDATFCRECGSDDQTGWSEDAERTQFDCGNEFDYDEFIEREFPDSNPMSTGESVKKNAVILIVILTCISLLYLLF